MSAIYFHHRGEKREDRAHLSGAERAYMGQMCRGLSEQVFFDRFPSPELVARLRSMIPPNHKLKESLLVNQDPRNEYIDADKFARSFLLHFGGSFDDGLLTWNPLTSMPGPGYNLNSFWIQLNAALAIGSDPVKLAARLHGQCELHAWVAEANRPWLARIIEEGLRKNVLREMLIRDGRKIPMGWYRVAEMLRAVDVRGSFVTSYSVCDSFPNPYVAGFEDRDAFYALDREEQWDLAFEKLVNNSRGLELKPDNWDDFFFGDGISALDLVSDDYATIIQEKIVEALR